VFVHFAETHRIFVLMQEGLSKGIMFNEVYLVHMILYSISFLAFWTDLIFNKIKENVIDVAKMCFYLFKCISRPVG
jgi:hypothetical protein